MGFSGQEYWNGSQFPPPEDYLDPGIEPMSPVLADGFFITEPFVSQVHMHFLLKSLKIPPRGWGGNLFTRIKFPKLFFFFNFIDQIYLEKTTSLNKGWKFTSEDISQVLSLQISSYFHNFYIY